MNGAGKVRAGGRAGGPLRARPAAEKSASLCWKLGVYPKVVASSLWRQQQWAQHPSRMQGSGGKGARGWRTNKWMSVHSSEGWWGRAAACDAAKCPVSLPCVCHNFFFIIFSCLLVSLEKILYYFVWNIRYMLDNFKHVLLAVGPHQACSQAKITLGT